MALVPAPHARQLQQQQALQTTVEREEHQARIAVALEARASFRRAFGRPFDQQAQSGCSPGASLNVSDITMSSVFAGSCRRGSATDAQLSSPSSFGIRDLVDSFAALEYSLRQQALQDMAASQGAVSEVELTEHRVKGRMATMVAGMLMESSGSGGVVQGSPVSAARRRQRSSVSDWGLQLSPRTLATLHEIVREPTLAEREESAIWRRRAADDDETLLHPTTHKHAPPPRTTTQPQAQTQPRPSPQEDERELRSAAAVARRVEAAGRTFRRRCADLCAGESEARTVLLGAASSPGGPFWAVTRCVELSETAGRLAIEEEALLGFALSIWHGVGEGLAWLHFQASLDGAQRAGERLRAAEAYQRATNVSEEAAVRRELRRALVAGPSEDYVAQRRRQDELDRVATDARYARRLELARQRDDRRLAAVVERQRELASHQRGVVEVRRRVRDEASFLIASEAHPRATVVQEEAAAYPYDAIRTGLEQLEEAVRADAAAALTLHLHEAFGSLLLQRMCADVLGTFAAFAAERDMAAAGADVASVAAARGQVDAETARRVARHADAEFRACVRQREEMAAAQRLHSAAAFASDVNDKTQHHGADVAADERQQRLSKAAERMQRARAAAQPLL